MPVPSRITLYDRLSAYRDSLGENVIITKPPAEVVHNAKARLFRNGLAVMGFAILEDFIRTRTAEVLERVGHGSTAFVDLPDQLKLASTIGAIDGLRFRASFLEKSSPDYYSYVQTHSGNVASTASAAYQLSTLSFANNHPNLQVSDIEAVLSAFHVDQPWTAIDAMANRSGAGVIGIKGGFQNSLNRRNMAAHRANSDIEFAELTSFVGVAEVLASSFDLLLSNALRKILDSDYNFLKGTPKLAANHISIRFISKAGHYWREVVDRNTKASHRHRSLDRLTTDCIIRARSNQQSVIVKDEQGRIANWYTPFID